MVTESSENPVFGQRVPGASYVQRPSVYAVIRDGLGHVALVRTAQGVFLPGGGIEADETPEQALLREVREECGFDIRLLSRLGDAVQLVYAQAEVAYFEKASTFFAAIVERHQSVPSERDHEVLWVASSEAALLVSHESHRWALRWSAS
jgi:8-oxo-dGTP diphosphatase